MFNKLLPTKVNRSIAGLFAANSIAFLVTGLSYIVYSKTLRPDEFGLYSIALAIGNFGTLVLDGGLKNTIIKSPDDLRKEEEGALLFLMIASSAIAIIVLVLIRYYLSINSSTAINDYDFLAVFSGIYWLSYPWISIPTASLERTMNYSGIAWIESIGIILERALPAIIILALQGGIYSFVWSVLLSRLFRVTCMNLLYKSSIYIPSWTQIKSIGYLLSEGFWLQLAVGASLLRDNLHTILVGLMFGKTWVGFYSWALQLSAISSQVFVAIATRVSIPLFARADTFENRWKSCIYQIKILTICIIPFLAVILITIPTVNNYFFAGKWTEAIALLPFLFLRMLTGLAITPVSSILMIQHGGRSLANATVLWTTLELVFAFIFLSAMGPMGLAWSYAIIVWLGLFIYILFIKKESIKLMKDIFNVLLRRSSLFVSIFLSAFIFLYGVKLGVHLENIYQCIFSSIFIMSLSYISEYEVRRFLGMAK
jgi:O-antigen/teichoic acid export membrane protein